MLGHDVGLPIGTNVDSLRPWVSFTVSVTPLLDVPVTLKARLLVNGAHEESLESDT